MCARRRCRDENAAGVGKRSIRGPDRAVAARRRCPGIGTWCASAGQPTGAAFICVSDRAENAITVASGANHALERPRSTCLPSDGCSHLLLQLEIPLDTVTALCAPAHVRGRRAGGTQCGAGAGAAARELPVAARHSDRQ